MTKPKKQLKWGGEPGVTRSGERSYSDGVSEGRGQMLKLLHDRAERAMFGWPGSAKSELMEAIFRNDA